MTGFDKKRNIAFIHATGRSKSKVKSALDRLQAWLRANGGPMTLLKGFAAGTPGFSPCEGKYGALAVASAIQLSDARVTRAQTFALLAGARQVRVCIKYPTSVIMSAESCRQVVWGKVLLVFCIEDWPFNAILSQHYLVSYQVSLHDGTSVHP